VCQPFQAAARRVVERGYRALKLDPFGAGFYEMARRLGLLLSVGCPAELIQTRAWFHPAGYVEFITTARKARIDAQASPDDGQYVGYAVALLWCSDHRNNTWQEAIGLAPSLEEAVTALHRWLAGQEEIDVIQQTFPWMRQETSSP
jgi:hypothetical protein